MDNYINTEDILHPPTVTKREMNCYLLVKAPVDSPFKRKRRTELVDAVFDAYELTDINPVYMVAHACLESAWGRSQIAKDKNNLFGYCAYDDTPYSSARDFKNYAHCCSVVMSDIKQNYLTESGKYFNGFHLQGMNINYATDENWAAVIRTIMDNMVRAISITMRSGRTLELACLPGDDVTLIQFLLNELGYQLVCDKHYGKKTEAVVKQFQEDINITIDGIAGEQTKQALFAFFVNNQGSSHEL